MAPDKIYRTTTYLDNDKGKVVWKKTPVNGAENIAYIRKDTLLEWLEIAVECYCEGKKWAFHDLINKIKSL